VEWCKGESATEKVSPEEGCSRPVQDGKNAAPGCWGGSATFLRKFSDAW